MEFWGVEVKAGHPLKVKPGTDKLIHISQASLGESKNSKEDERILLSVKFDNQKLVLGTLSSAKFPQLSFDLVFEKEFELSHNWKNGSVYFTGYRSVTAEEDEFSETESEEEQELDLSAVENGVEAKPSKQAKANANAAKSDASKKPKDKIVEKMDVDEDDSDDNEDDDDDNDDEDDESNDEGSDGEADSDSDDDEDEDDNEEETPKKAEVGKKRAPESATKTPDAKKAKVATPQKDGKNNATAPKTGKQSGKTPATDKSKTQTPKSAGQISCKSCSKTFNSDAALQSHSKAKHGGK